MPDCKYCGTPMGVATSHSTKMAFYLCPKCWSRGPTVKYAGKTGWREELDAKTLGRSADGVFASVEEDLRSRNDVLSGRYSKLKSCELPTINRILRETSRQLMDLQDGRGDYDKAGYLDAMSSLYHKKAVYLRHKAKYEDEFRSVREQIRENKKRLKDARNERMAGKKKRERKGATDEK